MHLGRKSGNGATNPFIYALTSIFSVTRAGDILVSLATKRATSALWRLDRSYFRLDGFRSGAPLTCGGPLENSAAPPIVSVPIAARAWRALFMSCRASAARSANAPSRRDVPAARVSERPSHRWSDRSANDAPEIAPQHYVVPGEPSGTVLARSVSKSVKTAL